MSDQKPAITLTADQLQQMLTTMAREIRKPAEDTPAQAAEKEQSKQMRKDRAQIELNKRASQKLNQSLCDHSREDGTSACVPVYDNRGNVDFLICQANQCVIRHGERPTGEAAKDVEMHIFDTQIFNRELRRSAKRPAMAY